LPGRHFATDVAKNGAKADIAQHQHCLMAIVADQAGSVAVPKDLGRIGRNE
jgi:hypothetical protein